MPTKHPERFYKGHDNSIDHLIRADAYIVAEDTLERLVPLPLDVATRVVITLKPVSGADPLPPEITFDSNAPPEADTFRMTNNGYLIVRYGDLANTVVGVVYEARIVVYDADSPDGLVVASYGDDATNDTWSLTCS